MQKKLTQKKLARYVVSAFSLLLVICTSITNADTLRVGTFDVDVSPPIGSPLAYDPCDGVAMSLRASGIVLMVDGPPVVLCAVDWIGIANDGYRQWIHSIANAVGTTPERVTVHTLHQHDAPYCDFASDRLLAEHGLGGLLFDVKFTQRAITDVARAAKAARDSATEITHVGLGESPVEKVASNRRILGPDGRVRATRYTACQDPQLRAEPVGTIDPMLKSISFWNEDTPIVVLTYYATHPQSYYRRGIANPDFPGMARFIRQVTLNGLPHVHFNGAGGNIGAGKFNDGSPQNRQVLAVRVARGMSDAWDATKKYAVTSKDTRWQTTKAILPAAPHLEEQQLQQIIGDESETSLNRGIAARNLIWLRRCLRNDSITVSSLKIGPAYIVHLPGEAVVEYQLFAQSLAPDQFVAVAAYGDYGTGYICLTEHYDQGGYEASQRASRVARGVESVLKQAIRDVLPAE